MCVGGGGRMVRETALRDSISVYMEPSARGREKEK